MRARCLLAAAAMITAVPTAAAAAPPDGHPASGRPIAEVVTLGDSWVLADFCVGTRPEGSWSQLLAAEYGDTQSADSSGGSNDARGGAFISPIAPYSTADPPRRSPNRGARTWPSTGGSCRTRS